MNGLRVVVLSEKHLDHIAKVVALDFAKSTNREERQLGYDALESLSEHDPLDMWIRREKR
jgi:hypothetical protein